MTDWGIFSEGGMIEGPFYGNAGKRDADDAAMAYLVNGEEVEVLALCVDHPEQPEIGCEECEDDAE